MPDARQVAIYRHQLFKVSEPFITQQAGALRTFHPIYVGRKLFGRPPSGADVVAPLAGGTWSAQTARLWHSLTRAPGRFVRPLREARVALVHAHFGVEGIYALKLARALKVPLVTTFHGYDATRTRRNLLLSGKPSWINYVLWRDGLARRGQLFICVSDFIRQRVLRMGFPEDRTVTHYIGTDLKSYPTASAAGREGLLLHIARLVEQKGTADLIAAFARIAPRHRDVQLVVIGDGPLRGGLEALAGRLGVAARVRFLGAVPHDVVLRWLSKAAIFCLPSVTVRSGAVEGLGMVVVEAAAMGVPVVATRHGGIPEAVEEGRTGYLVPEHGVNDLADRLSWLLEHDAQREAMGCAGQRMVAEKFDIDRQCRKLEAHYEALL